MKYFEDMDVGEVTVFPARYTMTEENICAMGEQWDPYPFHTDAAAAAESLYGGLVASTVHLFAVSVKLCHSATELFAAVGSLGITDVVNHSPAYVGDELRCECTTVETRASKSRPGLGIMSAQSQLITADDRLVFSYVSTALYQMRPVPS